MKRALAVLFSVALLALVLTACGTGKDNTTGSHSASNGDYNTDSAAPGDAVLGDTTPDAIPDNGTTDNKDQTTDGSDMTSDLEHDTKTAVDHLEDGVEDAARDVKDAVDGAARSTEPKEDDPTLTFNTLGRHVSRMVYTRITSVKSPWMAGVSAGDIHAVPVSHGEGRFVADEKALKKIVEGISYYNAKRYFNL